MTAASTTLDDGNMTVGDFSSAFGISRRIIFPSYTLSESGLIMNFPLEARLLTALLAFSAVRASGVEAELAHFEEKIRPVLIRHCYECHSDEEGKSKGGLKVDTRRALLQGGDSGAAIVPRDLEASLLMTSIRYHDPEYEMPPKGPLPAEVIRDFETWIAQGAHDPRVAPSPVASPRSEIDLEAGRKFWAYRAPEVSGSERAIDAFIDEGLSAHGLTRSAAARPETLVRRLYFTLCGLPPSPADVVRWTQALGPDLDPAALRQLVDTLLASPRYGERWGQHWLDVARYADSTGGDSNNLYPNAWRYRDYVIDSFNADKPFDQFIREQLAGDLLKSDSKREAAERWIATGFLAIGQKLVGETDAMKFHADLVDEQIDTVTRAFLGTTVACARCHDHKSDPIPQEDYYALAAIFRNTETRFGLLEAQARQSSTLIDVTGYGLSAGRQDLADSEYARLQAELAEAEAQMEEVRSGIWNPDVDISRAKLRRSRTQLDRAEAALAAYDADGQPLTLIMGAEEAVSKVETRLLIRGEIDRPGGRVSPGFLQVASSGSPPVIAGSGRLELAEWIASENNPLTARVMSNRIWHWLFGQGLVRSVDDFGATGELPSHPELLDYLALRLVDADWSVKSLIREIVLSRTWQQSSHYHEANFEIDPDNRYLWRVPPRRLEGEAIRDALLTVSGLVVTGPPESPLLDLVGEGTVGQNVYEPEIRAIEAPVRSVYLPRVRNVIPEALAVFDAPDASQVGGARETTTSPLQSLYLLNHDVMIERARAFASLVAEQPAREQIRFAHLKAFGRSPTARERDIAATFARSFRTEDSAETALTVYCHALLCTAEFSLLE